MEIGLKTIVSRLRPCRCAVLVHQEVPDWRSRVLSIIAWQSTFWGGSDTLIIPTDGKTIDPFFWDILDIHKPDYFFRYIGSEKMQRGATGLVIDPELDREIRRRLNPFYLSDKACLFFIKDGDGCPKKGIPVKSLLDESDDLLIRDYQFAGLPREIELMVRNNIGSSTTLVPPKPFDAHRFGQKSTNFRVAVFNFFIERNSFLDSFTREIGNGRFPFELTNQHLSRYYFPELSPFRNDSAPPNVIIVYGDSLQDFLAFANLSKISEGIFWFPSILLDEQYADLLYQALELVFMTADHFDPIEKRKVQVISRSVNNEVIQTCFEQLRNSARYISTHGDRNFLIGQPFDIHNLFVFKRYEQGKQNLVGLHQFIDNKSANLLDIPRPSFSRRLSVTEQWLVELEILGEGQNSVDLGYVLPEMPDFNFHLLADLHYVKNAPFMRIDGDSFVLQRPQSGLIIAGTTLDDYLVNPRISLLSNFEIFEQLFSGLTLTMAISDKGNYMRASVDLLGSIDALAEELVDPGTVKMLDAYINDAKPSERVKHKIPGILVNDRVYLNFEQLTEVLGEAEAASKKLDRYLHQGIFTKGFIFQCAKCRAADWYRLEEVGQRFTCRRCQLDQVFTQTHWKEGHQPSLFYKLDEMFYQGYQHNMKVPVLTLRSLRAKARKSFIYLPEVVLTSKDNSNIKSELDILCIQDGQLIIGESKKDNAIEIKQLNAYHDLVNKLNATFVFSSLSGDLSEVIRKISARNWLKEPIILPLADK
jgi:hypothetical protein